MKGIELFVFGNDSILIKEELVNLLRVMYNDGRLMYGEVREYVVNGDEESILIDRVGM